MCQKIIFLSLIKTEKKYPWTKLLLYSTVVKYQVMQSMICVQVATIAEWINCDRMKLIRSRKCLKKALKMISNIQMDRWIDWSLYRAPAEWNPKKKPKPIIIHLVNDINLMSCSLLIQKIMHVWHKLQQLFKSVPEWNQNSHFVSFCHCCRFRVFRSNYDSMCLCDRLLCITL